MTPVIVDSITLIGAEARGSVVVSGSHGGVTAGEYAAKAGVSGVIFNDAGVGKNQAGVSGLAFLDHLDIMGAVVAHLSARIGDGFDTLESGIVSHHNQAAHTAGVRDGMPARQAARAMTEMRPSSVSNARSILPRTAHRPRVALIDGRSRVVLMDSAAQLNEGNEADVVITGSHGGRVAGRAVKHPVFAAFFNDAGIGKDSAGISRLPLLDQQGIAGLAVDYRTAEIGNALDAFDFGLVSTVNKSALTLGISAGSTVRCAAESLLRTAARGKALVHHCSEEERCRP